MALLSPAADFWHAPKCNIHTAAQLAPSSWTLSLLHTHKLLSLLASQAHIFLSSPPPLHSFVPFLHQFPANSTPTCTKLSFVCFFFFILTTMLFVFQGAEQRDAARQPSLPRPPVSPACHPLCVCSDVWRALSAIGLCLFWAAPGLIMAHYWGTRGS